MDLRNHAIGKEDRLNMSKKILDKSAFPNTVGYKDIDASFKEWLITNSKISYNGKNSLQWNYIPIRGYQNLHRNIRIKWKYGNEFQNHNKG